MIRSSVVSALSVSVLLGGCVLGDPAVKPVTNAPLKGAEKIFSVPKDRTPRLGDPFIKAGLENLASGRYVVAQKAFNRALKFDPRNSSLHFLNAMTYHLRAANGDTSQRELAVAGYRLALEHDASNFWAAFQLGHINFEEQRYAEAQEAFAYALLYAPKDTAVLKALAAASYRAQDIETAVAAAEKIDDRDPGFLRTAAMINAAAGRFKKADGFVRDYQGAVGVNPAWSARLNARIDDWRKFHKDNATQLAQAWQLTPSPQPTPTAPPSAAPVAPTTPTIDLNIMTQPVNPSSRLPIDATGPRAFPNAPVGAADSAATKMAMVDVVIIRSEERKVTNKGVNLLNGLSATLGGTTLTYNDARTINFAAANTHVKTLTYAPTLSVSATYSLNIFNDNNDHNEILARPSLVALDGRTSNFFTGAVVHVEIAGASGSTGVVTPVPIGIKLELTPRFRASGKVELSVRAIREFIENRSNQIGFNNSTQVTKTDISADVLMNFGDTLILGGLSEKETEALHDGVPLLQDIPGVQYLFSNQATLDFTKSVLILITPRQPRYTYADGTEKAPKEKPAAKPQPSLDKLKEQVDWFRPTENLDYVFEHLRQYEFFNAYRTGDVTLEDWDNPVGIMERLEHAVDFLWY